jgi:hypothetical protein
VQRHLAHPLILLDHALAWLTTRCGVVSFHGPMLEGRLARGEAAYDRSSFERVLTRAEPAFLAFAEALRVDQPLDGGDQLLPSHAVDPAFPNPRRGAAGPGERLPMQ